MDHQLEGVIEKLDKIKTSLENETNYAVIWLGETLDFLNNEDIAMALWSYGKYLEVLNNIDMDLYKSSGKLLHEKLQALMAKQEG